MIKRIYHLILITLLCGYCVEVAAGAGFLNLAETPTAPRFKLSDRDWPSKPGEASICLWNDDKLAAFSLTIDDNCAMDVPWWLEQSKALRLPITWFLISDGVDNPKSGRYQGMTGTWALWKNVLASGNAVESHSVMHWKGIDKTGRMPADWLGWEWECSESIKQVEAGIPGHKVRFFAFPGSTPAADKDQPGMGDAAWMRQVASKYYLTVRAGRGYNYANQLDYMCVKCISRVAELDEYFAPKSKAYRGWANAMTHFVGNEKNKAVAVQYLGFFKNHASDLWGGLFGDVARYGQERDTAKLVVEENSSIRIAFTLTDQMNDEFYDYPLTVKVRLPNTWKGASVRQNNATIPIQVVAHEGVPYALVKAAPDRGQVTLMPAAAQ